MRLGSDSPAHSLNCDTVGLILQNAVAVSPTDQLGPIISGAFGSTNRLWHLVDHYYSDDYDNDY